MRTLKRTLSLALVLVMALGLMMSASAATTFTDKADIQYNEGVEVMTGIGAISGYPDGSFAPDGLVTRGEAAKMIAYAVLGPTVASNLGTTSSSFKDVPATLWSAKYIQFCVSRGIVSGRGAGIFDPSGNVTSYELAKMMLTAAGYGKNGEYVGASWSLNVAIDAFDKGIFTASKDANLADAATREEAALYIFNGISKIDQVVFSADTQSYVLTVLGGQTIGEMKYGLASVSTTVNGVTGYTWQNTIGTALSSFVASDNVIGTSTDGTTVANLSTSTYYKFIAAVDGATSYYYNGSLTSTTSTMTTANAILAVAKKGVIVSFINTDLDATAEKVVITEKTVAMATAVPYVNATTGAVTIAGVTYVKDTVVYPADIAPYTYILRYTDALGITHIEKAAVVKGQMTASNSDGTIKFAGANYSNSGLVASTVLSTFAASTNYNVNATAYLDNNGSIVAIATDYVVSNTKYGLVVGYSYVPAAGSGLLATAAYAKVQLYTEDGAVAIYDVALNASYVVPDQSASFTGNANLVSYVIDAAGKVTLTKVGSADTMSAAYSAKATTVGLTTAAKAVYITSATKVIYFNDGATYNAYTNTAKFVTGYSSTEDAVINETVSYVLTTGTNNVAAILIGKAPVSTVAGNYAYVVTPSVSTRYVGTTAYYDYSTFVGGVAKTLTSTTSGLFTTAGQYTFAVDASGNVSGTPVLSGNVTGGNVAYVDAGFVAYVDGGVNVSVPVTAATKYYQVIAYVGAVEAPIVASSTYTAYNVTAIQKDLYGNAVAIYFTVTIS